MMSEKLILQLSSDNKLARTSFQWEDRLEMKRSVKGFLADGMNGDEPNELWLTVELPVGMKPTDAVFHSRLKQLAAVADKIGFKQTIFGHTQE